MHFLFYSHRLFYIFFLICKMYLNILPFVCFSFDVRGRPFTKALYWTDPNAFGPRAYFVTGSKPAGLTLESVQLDDEGIYRCRVDFKNSPTRNFQINLTVIGK